MKVLIIGWYGTETIGDRAILAGLVQLLTKELGEIELTLGSLYPFYSERTINEDSATIQATSSNKVIFSIVDTRNPLQLEMAVINSDLVIMGGGPLMDLEELYMVDYAFKLAKKEKKKTAILGCGIGPLFQKKYRKLVVSIINNSDVSVLRDKSSKKALNEMYDEFSLDFSACDIKVGFDPAVHYASKVKELIKLQPCSEYISINLRSFPAEYSKDEKKNSINTMLENFVDSLSDFYSDTDILLTPMHYFHIGDDDRYFLNQIKFRLGKGNIQVQNKPLSLESTVVNYANAKFNIGMRFHSVVLQTILSGKNFILDYTQPKVGKISGFISDIDESGFYEKRHIYLQEQDSDFNFEFSNIDERFCYESYLINQSEQTYLLAIRGLKL